jgi:hypothetical protein
MIFQILEIFIIELVCMSTKIIVFTMLVVLSVLLGFASITDQNVDVFGEINISNYKNSHFELGSSLVSDQYDSVSQYNNYNPHEYTNDPILFNIDHIQQPSFAYQQDKNNYLNDYEYNNYYDYRNEFVAQLDPYPVIYHNEYYFLDSYGIAYLSLDYFTKELSYRVFVQGMSYLEGDDVEIIQIHLGANGQNGPTILSLCNEKIGKGHCREGPGLSVEGILEENDLKGPLKGSSFDELMEIFTSGKSYVYVQSRDHPEGEMRGQIYY